MASANVPIGVQNLTRARILVVGDLILDHYVRGITERTSPEAPVPVVLVRSEERIPGGAANVARNIAAAGAHAVCAGAVGRDADGRSLVQSLQATGIDCQAVIETTDRPTTTKTRIISQSQQMLRIDREEVHPLAADASGQLLRACVQCLPTCDAVVVSDYAKGVLSAEFLATLTGEARAAGKPLFVDPKGRDYTRYNGATCLTPNAKEAYEATGIPTADQAGLAAAAGTILDGTGCEFLAITRGAEGIALFSRGPLGDASEGPGAADATHGLASLLIPATAREVFDVTGAGDTFVAFLAMAVATGMTFADAARLANAAAGVVVGKVGAATVSLFELRTAINPASTTRKLRTPEELGLLGEQLRAAGRKIVFTNGCFDFIHAGHVAFLQQARALGDVLVLATNTDDMIARLKGAPRPIIKQGQRERLLAAIEAVDYIIPFPDETPHELIRLLKPHVLVKGSNYKRAQVEGHEIVESYGGRVELLDIIEDISTRELVARTSKR